MLSIITLMNVVPSQSLALSGADFNAGNIIGDSIFFSPGTMNPDQIQAFLNAKVPVCDTNHAPLGSNNPPFTCLKDYTQAVPNVDANAYCSYIGGSGTVYSAAQMIYIVSQSCGINPQVMIVLLQKEQSLVTDTWPLQSQYNRATGYGCPDSGPNYSANCDSQYYGFFNQIYNAAKQLNRYTQQPQLFNYAAGRTSYIPYHPNPSCGGTNILVQNKATAALYNYTPYQPNVTALSNIYGGQSDGCSSYGNRNFWRMFSDWFGATSGDLVRTPSNGTVYLISGDTKYPINSLNILADYANLGPIRFVNDDFVNSKATGPFLNRMVQSPDQSLYFVNASIRLPFTSCGGDVIDYGFTCAEGQFARITQEQTYKLANGPAVSKLILSTGSGTIYVMSQGKKLPVAGWSDLLSLNLPISWNVLTENMLADYPNGQIIYKPGTLVKTADSSTVYVIKDNTSIYPISSFAIPSELGLSNLRTIPSGEPQKRSNVSPVSNKIICNSKNYLATGGKSYPLSSSDMTLYGFTQVQFTDAGSLCPNIALSSTALGRYLRSSTGSIYYINNSGQKQAFTSYNTYINHQASNGNPGYTQAGDYFLNSLQSGSNL